MSTWSIAQWRAGVRVTNVWNDPRDCRPREDCTPFTFAFHAPSCEKDTKAQSAFTKKLATLTKKQATAARKREKLLALAA